jgi:Fe-S cluster biosynthesis and repair protein YggX
VTDSVAVKHPSQLETSKLKLDNQGMPETIKCVHCGEKRPAIAFAPFPNELGQRIAAEICQPCWSGWLQKQSQIINHYGLDLTNPDAQNFLFDNIKGFLFGEVPQTAEIDTSKEGTVKW